MNASNELYYDEISLLEGGENVSTVVWGARFGSVLVEDLFWRRCFACSFLSTDFAT